MQALLECVAVADHRPDWFVNSIDKLVTENARILTPPDAL